MEDHPTRKYFIWTNLANLQLESSHGNKAKMVRERRGGTLVKVGRVPGDKAGQQSEQKRRANGEKLRWRGD